MFGFAVKTHIMATSLARRLQDRASDERGQTLVEYLGVLALVASIIVAIVVLDLDEKVKSAIEDAIDAATDR
jgi:Flp pilus assembly pilin Flp